jgi:hypothetical protein
VRSGRTHRGSGGGIRTEAHKPRLWHEGRSLRAPTVARRVRSLHRLRSLTRHTWATAALRGVSLEPRPLAAHSFARRGISVGRAATRSAPLRYGPVPSSPHALLHRATQRDCTLQHLPVLTPKGNGSLGTGSGASVASLRSSFSLGCSRWGRYPTPLTAPADPHSACDVPSPLQSASLFAGSAQVRPTAPQRSIKAQARHSQYSGGPVPVGR